MKTHAKILTVVIGSIVAASCANQNIVKEPVSKPDAVVKDVEPCKAIVRNLTLPWQSSQVTCDENRVSQKQIQNLAEIEEQEALEKRSVRNAYLAEKRKEREEAAVMYSAEVLLSNQRNIQESSPSHSNNVMAIQKQVDTTASNAVNDRTSSESVSGDHFIWFAKNLRVLGPQGQSSVSHIAPGLADSNTPIQLRGYFLEDELQGYDPEVFSVARALAVKKQLVEVENVDPERITILHHKPDVNARYVGVSVNG